MSMNKKHVLIMLACCLIPLAALGAIAIFRVPVTSVVFVGLILLCPAMHLLMMRNMTGHDHSGQAHDPLDPPVARPLLQNRAPVDERKG
jgi:uncharacterized membrane protein